MRLSQYIERQPKTRRTPSSPVKGRSGIRSGALAAHASFVPMVTAWGAALLGLAVVVLPAAIIARMNMVTGLGSLGPVAQYIYAAAAALLGGGIAFVIAGGLREKARASDEGQSIVSAVQSRRVHPINPATDLGSDSLDAPIEEMPFGVDAHGDEFAEDDVPAEFEELQAEPPKKRQPTLGELSKRGYEMEAPEERNADANDGDELRITRKHFQTALIETCEGATCEAAPAAKAEEPAAEPDTKPETPPEIAPVTAPATAPEEVTDKEDDDMAQVLLKAKPAGQSNVIGRPGSNGSWSLTQFAPSEETAPKTAPQPAPQKVAEIVPEKPRELDLSEFAQIPGRNAVWVEGSAEETPAETAEIVKPASPPQSAIEKLRQKSPEDLSLVEMVERFAGALHQRQQADHARLPKAGPTRDAALAEALKALTLFTERGFDQSEPQPTPSANPVSESGQLGQTERELREALVKLQTLRGAA